MSSKSRKVRRAIDRDALARICEADEESFGADYGMTTVNVEQKSPADYYHYRDNGSAILAVAHLDTVVPRHQRMCRFVDTAGGPVVYSGGLDDRLGAFIILDLLPALGITHDVLLTVGEECGQSTAAYFDAPKHYDWVIEFDRGGTDVVMYDYEDDETIQLVEDSGARVGMGSFSDISYMEHVGVKAFNWGVGYHDYHGPRAHAYLDDTALMVARYLRFHEANTGTYLPHEARPVLIGGARYDWDAESWEDDDDNDDARLWADDDVISAAGDWRKDPKYRAWVDSTTPLWGPR